MITLDQAWSREAQGLAALGFLAEQESVAGKRRIDARHPRRAAGDKILTVS